MEKMYLILIKAILNNYNYFKLYIHFQVLVNFIFESLYFFFVNKSLYFWSFIIINYGKQKGSDTLTKNVTRTFDTYFGINFSHIPQNRNTENNYVLLKKAPLLKYLKIMVKIWYIDMKLNKCDVAGLSNGLKKPR